LNDSPPQLLIDDALHAFETCRRSQLLVDDGAGLLLRVYDVMEEIGALDVGLHSIYRNGAGYGFVTAVNHRKPSRNLRARS
jgi:hypothetical protein